MDKVSFSNARVKNLAMMALFTALVVVLQFVGAFIHLGFFSVSLVLVPIVIGAAMCGPWAGAWLGGVFGLVVLISGDAGLFLPVNPAGTVITVMLKGILSGLSAGAVYALLEKKSTFVAVVAAAIVCPVVNTGVFILGCLVFFLDFCVEYAESFGVTGNAVVVVLVFFVGLNFFFELGVNVVLAGVIERLIKLGKRTLKKS